MLKHSLVVVANGSEAKIYKYVNEGKALQEEGGISNIARRQRDQDLVTDRPGRMSGSGGHMPGQDAMSPSSPNQHIKKEFAQDIIDKIDERRKTNELSSVDIVAEASMLGLLRESMNSPMKRLVDKTISKDITYKSPQEVLKLLKQPLH